MADQHPNYPPDEYASAPVRPDAVPGPGRSYDWALIVAMLSEGHKVGEVARFTGCSRSQIWRILRRSNVARSLLHEVRVRRAVESGTRLELARDAAVELILSEVKGGNLRAALWVADRLGVSSWGYPTKPLAPGDAPQDATTANPPEDPHDPDRSLYVDPDGNPVPTPGGSEFSLRLDEDNA
jgi:hypothetical protein